MMSSHGSRKLVRVLVSCVAGAVAGAAYGQEQVIIRNTDVLNVSAPMFLSADSPNNGDLTLLRAAGFIGAEWSDGFVSYSVGDPVGILDGFVQASLTEGRIGVEVGFELSNQQFFAEVKPEFSIVAPLLVEPGQEVFMTARGAMREGVRHQVSGGTTSAFLDVVGHGRIRLQFGGSVGSTTYFAQLFEVFNAGTADSGLRTRILEAGPGNSVGFAIPPASSINLRTPDESEFEVAEGVSTNSGLRRSQAQVLTSPVASFDTSLTQLFATVAGLNWGWGSGAQIGITGASFEPVAGTGVTLTLVDVTLQQGFLLRQTTEFTVTDIDFNFDRIQSSAGEIPVTDVFTGSIFGTGDQFSFQVPPGVQPGEVLTVDYSINVLATMVTRTFLTTGNVLEYTAFGASITLGGFTLFEEALIRGTMPHAFGNGRLLGEGRTNLGGSDFGILRGSFTITVIPEPGTAVLASGAAAAVLIQRRRGGRPGWA